ncbi:MAG: Fe-S oxidoreductase, partial [Saprospiraceae bacterium]|nr:Fe-S oxidoreductase [Saprospiraceae bacterium]
MIQSILFLLITGFSGWYAYKGFSRVYRNIMLGKAEATTGDTGERWKNMMLVALGQQKMFKNWIPAVL